MIGPESKNDFQRKDAPARYPGASTVARSHQAAEEISGMRRAHKFVTPAPFNGLLTNKLLTQLPGEDFARLLPYLTPVSLSCGEDLYRFGESINDVYFPETAVISHLHFMEDGSMTSAALIGCEGLVGLSAIFDAPTPSYWTQVTIGGSAMRVEAEVIKKEFDRGGEMQRLLLSYTSIRLSQLSQRAVCNGRHRLDQRLCTWLLMIHDRAGDKQLPLTHEEIAHHLGLRRAGITTACNVLRDGGAINYQRGMIRILDRQILEAAACECYRVLGQAVETPLRPKGITHVR
ncbi:MAG TPA: Crp/Fnr family transcriptional regulator [Pyrinomonadaceae bacterium]|jgi:CRP-like cAMP-binding protein|nr:Crp/Fnr family transcriptional regulator [Pyrinomonadaceae bacterium]